MNKAPVYNQTGEQVSEAELESKIFAREKLNPSLIHEVVTAALANSRNTVASAKTRGQVRGGGRKPWQQKGTGRARAGSIRSPLWRGGGVTFGPSSARNFSKKVNKQARRAALFTALTDKAKGNQLFILDNLQISHGKTKELKNLLDFLSAKLKLGKKLLIVLPADQAEITKAGQNLAKVKVTTARGLNVLDLLTAQSVIVLKDALPVIKETFLK